jgi:hypothetical protein
VREVLVLETKDTAEVSSRNGRWQLPPGSNFDVFSAFSAVSAQSSGQRACEHVQNIRRGAVFCACPRQLANPAGQGNKEATSDATAEVSGPLGAPDPQVHGGLVF